MGSLFKSNAGAVTEVLWDAIERNDAEAVNSSLRSVANIKDRDEYGQAPLHWAGDKEVAKLLISKGADIEARNNNGLTPLGFASFNGHKEVAELLLKHGAKERII